MKACFLGIALVTMCTVTAALCQEPEEMEAAEQQLHLRGRQLELEAHESELALKREMGRLELDKRRLELEHARKAQEHPGVHKFKGKPGPHPLLLIVLVVHILVAVWIYQDIRARNAGSGIWIVVGLLTGLLGALVYAVVRLGDSKQPKNNK